MEPPVQLTKAREIGMIAQQWQLSTISTFCIQLEEFTATVFNVDMYIDNANNAMNNSTTL